jgi:hypothetical protein
MGTIPSGILSDGVSTSLKPTPTGVSRRLTVRYDGHCISHPMQAHHGISILQDCNVAFPVPGRLAGNQPIPQNMVARLAGLTAAWQLPHYLWRQQHSVERSPDLPSN